MALKKKVTAEVYGALEASVQALYIASGDDFVLDLEAEDGDDDDVVKLRDKRRIAEEHRVKAEKRAKKAEDDLQALRDEQDANKDDKSKKTGDVAALETSWKAKLAKREAELMKERDDSRAHLEAVMLDSVADSMSTALSKVPKLLRPIIRARLAIEIEDGTPVVRVLDDAGELSAASLDDLKAEIAGNKDFASVIIASNGSGGGNRGGREKPGGAGAKKFSELTENERVEWHQRDPNGFAKASQEANS